MQTALLQSLARISPSLTAGATFAVSGAAFAVGNLLLARQMGTAEYAMLSLGVAVFIVTSQIATLGFSQVAARQRLSPGAGLAGRLFAQGLVGGVIAALLLGFRQGPGPATLALLVLLIACGPLIWVATAALLREGHRTGAYLMQTSPDWVLLVLGLLAMLAPAWANDAALAGYCVAVAALALAGWLAHAAKLKGVALERAAVSRHVLISATAIVAAGVLITQFERLAVGFLLQPQDLAMFSVLASIAVFPFRLVTAGTGFVLIPGLRRMQRVEDRRRLVRRELRIILVVLAVASLTLVLIGPQVASWFTAGRYVPGYGLLAAACFAGAAKVADAFPRAIVTACGTDADLRRLSQFLWLGLVLSALGALGGMWAGLAGVICGVASGSIAGSLPAMRMARRLLKLPGAPDRH